MHISIVCKEKHYEITYPVFQKDVFPEYETEEEMIHILKDMMSLAMEKIIEDKAIHPTAMIQKLMLLIEQFRFVDPVIEINEEKLKLLIGLLEVLKLSFDTWVQEAERLIKNAYLAHIIKKKRETKNEVS